LYFDSLTMGPMISRQKNEKKSKKLRSKSKVSEGKVAANSNCNELPGKCIYSENFPKLRALYSYQARDSNEVSFVVDDILYAMQDITGKNWYEAKNIKTGEIGLIPYNYVCIEDGSPSSLDCYYDVNRVEAERLLQVMSNISGTYLIRPSADKPNMALSVRILGADEVWTVRHFIIRKTGNKWNIVSTTSFESVKKLLEHYTTNKIYMNHCLTVHLPRNQSPPIHFKEMEVSRNNFIKEEVIGKGNFGEVWKARWGQNSNHYVAIKVVQTNMMSNDQFLDEAKKLHSLRHPKIVELLGVCTQPESEPIYIITEFMANGSLLTFIRSPLGKQFNLKQLIDIIAQISEGMAYLESKYYVHRDLRAANILVDPNSFVKVADFGLARVMQQDDQTYNANESKFPIRWTAPEAAFEGRFSIKSDVWSFGVLIYEIITYGCIPYAGMSTKEVITEIVKRNYRLVNPHGMNWNNVVVNCPASLYNLMFSCWNTVPDERPTFYSLQGTLSNWDISTEAQYEEQ